MTTLWHLPEDGAGKNPYGMLLVQSLEARGVRVVPIPYGHLFARRALVERPDILHFQFVQPYLLPFEQPHSRWRAAVKGATFLAQIALIRLAGRRIVWTVHNLVNHERRLERFEWFFTLLFTRLAHQLIVHGESAKQAVIDRYRIRRPHEKITVLFHPNFIGTYPDHVTQSEARQQLGIGARSIVILSLGQIREYKGLPDLLRAFRSASRPGAELWIAGEPIDRELTNELKQAAALSPDVQVRDAFMTPDELERLFKACDVVALPYRAILTSGAALLAMSYGKPCIAPRIGTLVEVLDEQGAFLYDPAEPDGLRDAIERALQASDKLAAMGEHNKTRAQSWSWPRAAAILTDLYDRLLGVRSQAATQSEIA